MPKEIKKTKRFDILLKKGWKKEIKEIEKLQKEKKT